MEGGFVGYHPTPDRTNLWDFTSFSFGRSEERMTVIVDRGDGLSVKRLTSANRFRGLSSISPMLIQSGNSNSLMPS